MARPTATAQHANQYPNTTPISFITARARSVGSPQKGSDSFSNASRARSPTPAQLAGGPSGSRIATSTHVGKPSVTSASPATNYHRPLSRSADAATAPNQTAPSPAATATPIRAATVRGRSPHQDAPAIQHHRTGVAIFTRVLGGRTPAQPFVHLHQEEAHAARPVRGAQAIDLRGAAVGDGAVGEGEDERHRLDGGVGEGMVFHPGNVAQGEAGGRRITARLRRGWGASRRQETKPAQDE